MKDVLGVFSVVVCGALMSVFSAFHRMLDGESPTFLRHHSVFGGVPWRFYGCFCLGSKHHVPKVYVFLGGVTIFVMVCLVFVFGKIYVVHDFLVLL